MKTEFKNICVIPYGMPKERLDALKLHGVRISTTWRRSERTEQYKNWHLLVMFSHLLNEEFVQNFHERATSETRLLVLNDCLGSDALLSRILDLHIRSSQRFYVAEAKFGAIHTNWDELLRSFISRITAAVDAKDSHHRILDARIDGPILHVVSPDFTRLEIPISKVRSLANVGEQSVQRFEIDVDGSYIYWPELDVHLGWEQLQQIVDPVAAQKAKQKNQDFNIRYGAAIQKIRLQRGLAPTDISGLSDKQIRRVESGECRLTSNAARKLAKAHSMAVNEYLELLAATLR